jgi:hypothetical protein
MARATHVQHEFQNSGWAQAGSLIQSFGSTAENAVQSIFTAKNVPLAMEEATQNAIKDMITQLMQIISQTMQSATDEMSSAQKNFESFAQMYRDFASTIAQGMYRS